MTIRPLHIDLPQNTRCDHPTGNRGAVLRDEIDHIAAAITNLALTLARGPR